MKTNHENDSKRNETLITLTLCPLFLWYSLPFIKNEYIRALKPLLFFFFFFFHIFFEDKSPFLAMISNCL